MRDISLYELLFFIYFYFFYYESALNEKFFNISPSKGLRLSPRRNVSYDRSRNNVLKNNK